MTRPLKLNQHGISLVEILLVVATIAILAALIANLPPSIGLIGQARHQSLANQIANKQIEDVRAITYENLADGQTDITDSRINLLPSGSGIILVEDCDPVNICSNNENMKQVTVTINWQESGKQKSVEIITMIGSGGLK